MLTWTALEIIVTDAREAALAQRAGATRLELIAERYRGGLTPPLEIIDRVTQAVTIPVHVIVRPHDRGFVYDPVNRGMILRDAGRAADLGAAALVVGALDARGDVDLPLIGAVREAASLPLTFHRAFDEARDPLAAYDALIRAPGVTRVLTSGTAPTAWEGRALLRELVGRCGPSVLAGGGITLANATDLVRTTGVREVHVGSGARDAEGRLDAHAIERIARSLETLERHAYAR